MGVLALRARRAADRLRAPATVVAWVLVASSATVAPFKYPELEWMRIPVVLLTAVGLWLLVAAARGRTAED